MYISQTLMDGEASLRGSKQRGNPETGQKLVGHWIASASLRNDGHDASWFIYYTSPFI
jgi:hypothetical protein